MSRSRYKLRPMAVERISKPGHHSDGAGLYLVVRKSGSKSWTYLWIRKGIRREMGLGGYPGVSLSRARELADNVRSQIANGFDPIAARQAEQKIMTFDEVADLVLAKKRKTWTNDKHGAQWIRSLKVSCAMISNLPVTVIDTPQVLDVLTPVWEKTPETGRRLRSRIEHVLSYATTRGWREGENPARWRGHLEHTLETRTGLKKNFPSMPYSEIQEFMELLKTKDAISAMALNFTILTAARTNETLGATWDEIDFDNALWTIPVDRMKMKVSHEVPLAPQTLDILHRLNENRFSDYIFPGQRSSKPISNMSMMMLLRRLGFGHYTVHGFRSTFRTWCGDQTSFPREIAEQALAHKIGSAVEQAYSRGKALEKRKPLMIDWADFCNNETSEKVVWLRA